MRMFFKGAFAGGVGAALILAASAALAGTGIGGIFNLGQTNSVNASSSLVGTTPDAQLQVSNADTGASSRAISSYGASPTAGTLYARNGGGGPAAAFSTLGTAAPFNVSSTTKVRYLNSDLLDSLDASAFLRNRVPLSLSGDNPAGGIINGTASTGNGVQGTSSDVSASGVYGENNGFGGYGVAGRTGAGGTAVYGDNTGGGWAGYFTSKVHLSGDLDCSGCVGASDLAAGAAASLKGYQIVSATTNHDSVVRTERHLNVDCPAGKRAVGGGGYAQPHPLATTAKAAIVESSPSLYYGPNGTEATGWFVQAKAMQDNYNTSLDVGVYAICADVSMN